MSFSNNIKSPLSEITTMVRIRPRKRIKGWVVDGGNPNIYRVSWDENIAGILINSDVNYIDQEYSESACIANSDSFFFDETNKIIVLNKSGSSPNIDYIVLEWDIYLATKSLNWYKNPLASNSGDQHWEGGVIRAPSPTQGNPDLIFGYSPVQISNLQFQVADGSYFKHLHDWSLRGASVKVWLCVGELDTENISELFVGVGESASMDNGVFTLQVQDPLRLLDNEWAGDSYSQDDFPNLAIDDEGLPIREVFGLARGFLPVNVSYDDPASTSNNRIWAVRKGTIADSPVLNSLIDHLSGSNTSIQTKLFSVHGFNFNDSIIIKDNGVDKYSKITGVDYTNNLIFHTAIGARSPVVTDTVQRGFISGITIRVTPPGFPEPEEIELQYGRDWTESNMAADTVGFTLVNNFEAAVSFPGGVFDPQQHVIFCNVYGSKILPKKLNGITDLGQTSKRGNTASHPAVVLWEILRNRIRNFREVALLDEDAFSDIALDFDRQIGLAVPETKSGSFPTYKEVAQLLLQTELLRMHFKLSNQLAMLTITQTSPASYPLVESSDNEIINPSYDWDYSDIYSRLRVQLNSGEANKSEFWIVDENSVFTYPDSTVELSPLRAAKYVHRVNNTLDFRTLFPYQISGENDLVAIRLSKLICERRGTLTCSLPVEFIDQIIDNSQAVRSNRLPGFAVDGQINERDYKVTRHSKSAQGIVITFEDQKGIADSTRW